MITYTLEAQGEDTLLTIRQSNVGTEEQKAHSDENWQAVLEELKKLLAT